MTANQKADSIVLTDFKSAPMRAFHVTWFSFCACFFAWFAVAPLMPLVRDELGLTKAQMADAMMASVAATVLARLVVGRMCDRYGPRRVYALLMGFSLLPLLLLAVSRGPGSFLLARFLLGTVGSAFVITQFHTSLMFSPRCVGTANATTAGWGNMGGGLAQIIMPLVVVGLGIVGFSPGQSWRVALLVPASALLLCALVYSRLTQDTPGGNYPLDRKKGTAKTESLGEVCKDPRVWVLFFAYGACFGLELIVHNMITAHFQERYELSLPAAGALAGTFGLLALFARTLGGLTSDRLGRLGGLTGRVWLLAFVLVLEGLGMMLFARAPTLPLAVCTLLVTGIFLHMSTGATFGLVPFVRKNSVGVVSGIVGAGGNLGAVAGALLFRLEGVTPTDALLLLGFLSVVIGMSVMLVRFKPEADASHFRDIQTNRPGEPIIAWAGPSASP